MLLQRKYNWPEILEARLLELAHTEFQYGVHDCCYFASGVIQRLTISELDIASNFGSYTTSIGAIRALKKAGYNSVEAFVAGITKQYNIPEITSSLAQRGDIILGIDDAGNRAAGICVGGHAAFAGYGIDYIPMSKVLRAWHYG